MIREYTLLSTALAVRHTKTNLEESCCAVRGGGTG
jgi:hypothetical protein